MQILARLSCLGEFMKIIHLTSVHEWNDTRIFVKMCRSLANAGHDVHLIVPALEDHVEKTVDGVRIHFVKRQRKRILRMSCTVLEVLKIAESLRGDLYHFHDPEFLLLAPFWQKRLKRPFIYDVHEDYRERIKVKEWLPKILRAPLAWLVARIETWATNQLAGVVSVTPGICQYFKKSCRTALVRNFPRMEEFLPDGDVVEPLSNNFAYVSGVLTKERGVDIAIRSISLLGRESRLALAGVWMDEAFYDYCKTLNGWERVDYLGYIDRVSLSNLIKNSLACLEIAKSTPGYEETYPTKLFECMAAGRPIIISKNPFYKPLVEEIGCGLMVDPECPMEIAAAMEWIVENPEKANEMGECGKEAIASRFNWDLEFPVLLEFYNNVIDEGRPRA